MSAKKRALLQNCMPAVLQLRIVIGGEAVEPNDFMAVDEKPSGHMEADEPGAASNENSHVAAGWRENNEKAINNKD